MKTASDFQAAAATMIDSLSVSSLTTLLNQSKAKPREIDRVAEHLTEILAAREQKITWDAIAAALNMNRGTLINGVKALTASPPPHRRPTLTQAMATLVPTSSMPSTAPTRPVAETRQDLFLHAPSEAATEEARPSPVSPTGITPLGRAKLEKFNL